MGESWLLPATLTDFRSVDLSWAAATVPAPAGVPTTSMDRGIGRAVSQLPARSIPATQLRI